jgi:DNA-binding CsgD family transcriptional regulator
MPQDLSRDDLLKLIDLAAGCARATSSAELSRFVDRLNDVLPFKRAALCALTAAGGELALDHCINHSYGERWESLYRRRGYAVVDPVLKHAFTATSPFAWHEAFHASPGPLFEEFVEAARDFDLVEGVAIGYAPARSSTARTVASFAITASEWSRARGILAVMGPHLLESYARLQSARDGAKDRDVLTEREREVLCWARQGKTYWEIGCILGISERTVKFHFARIKEKLDVVTPCHAVAKAMSMGLIA